MNTKISRLFFSFSFAGLCALLLFSCKSEIQDGMLIVTLSPSSNTAPDFKNGKGWRFISGSQIATVDPNNLSSEVILTKDFYSACSPDLSWDGRHLLFAGQKEAHDLWQIWEMDLDKNTFHKITNTDHNCTDPVYLPMDQLVYSMEVSDDSLGNRHELFTSRIDGSEIKQITFSPQNCFGSVVLMDGRVVTIVRQLLPVKNDPAYMVLRHDGTKADPLYDGNPGCILVNRMRERNHDRLFFVETDTLKKQSDILSISYNRPSTSKKNHSSNISGSFNAVFPSSSDQLWVSCSVENKPFAIYDFDIAQEQLGKCIYSNDKMNVTDVIEVLVHDRPKKLPSEVDMGVKTGLLVCLDLNYSTQQVLHPSVDFRKADRIEVLGIKSSYGIVQAEKDGSIYLKVMADTPFRIQTLDQNGKVVLGPGNWMWLRPNERRGVVSFYDNPELAPENIVPLAIKKDPVIIPVVITEVLEKEVELE